jgi:Bacterial Ig-like domain (group 3)
MRSIFRPLSCRAFGSLARRRQPDAASPPPSFAGASRRTRLWRAPLGVLVTLAVLANGLALTGGVAAADSSTSYPPPDLFNLSSLELPATLPSSGDYYAGGIYSATSAQITSLQDLEQEATANTISDHALAATDTEAVDSWARPDADAELWALLAQAIQAVQAGTADTDQQNAAAWLNAVVLRQGVLAAQAAGLEYSKWAGLGTSAYQDLIAGNPSESTLQSFLSATPEPYSDGGSYSNPSASADGGYCVYQSPSPYQSDYTANIFDGNDTPQTCYTPCTAIFGCPPVMPTYSQFIEYGDADVNDQLFDNSAFATDVNGIAMSGSLDGLATVGSIAAGLGTGFALGTSGVLAGSAFQTSVFPFANRPYVKTSANQAAEEDTESADDADAADVADAEAAGEDAADAAETAAEGALELVNGAAGAVAASGVGIIVSAVIFAVTSAVQEGLSVFSAAALPGQLAADIAGAPTATYDLGSMLSNSGEAQGLYSLFVGSTEPDPNFTSCNNNPGGIVIGSLDATPAAKAPCLNATTVPAEASYDPQWVVTPEGSTTSTTQPTITYSDAASQLTSTTYLSGNWFVNTATINGTAATTQSLRLQYTDWNGNEDTAWVFDNDNPPEFLVVNDSDLGSSFDPSTCLSSGACWETSTIDFVGGDGNDYSASVTGGGVEAPPLPPDPTPPSSLCSSDGSQLGCLSLNPTTTTVAASPATPGVGQPVTLTASMDDIIASGTVDFTDGSTVLCSDVPLQEADTETTLPGGLEEFQIYLAATCTTTFSTEGAHYVFATYGGDTYGDEPSQGELTLDVSNQAATTTTVTSDSATPVVGQLANYTASVSDYPGGPTPGGTVTFTSGSTTLCSGVALSSSGTAGCAYGFQAPGAETVTATYSGDANTFGSSGQVSVTVGQASSNTKVLVLTPAPFPGQTVTYQAIVQPAAPDIAGPGPGGTVTFTNDGTTVCSGVALSTTAPFAATCAQAYAASGDETVTATYSGDSNTIGSSGQASVSIRKAASNTSLSASTSAPVVGQPVAYTATVSTNAPDDPNPPAPTGTVTFTNGANTVCADVTLSTTAPYTATCSQTYTGPGFENLTANYSGDDAALASQAQAGVSVMKASSSTLITASAAAPVVGQPVTYSATVAVAPPDTSGPAPTGTITFQNGPTSLCSGLVLTATASATCTETYSSPGPETVTASYSGDTATLRSSAQAALDVSPASSVTSLTATATAVVGQPVTYTASVAVEAPDTNGPSPTGTITFTSGTATVCPAVPLSSSGTATCAQTYSSTGPETVTATYSGDNDTLGSSAQAAVSVNPASSSTSVSASTSAPVVGQPVTYTASVAVEAPDTNGPRPTGTITFTSGTATVCPAVPVSSSGTATCAQTYSSTGAQTLTATYSGDADTVGSSGPATVAVGQAATSTRLSASPASTSFGQVVTLTAQVAPSAPSTAGPLPSGTVSFAVDGQPVGGPVSLNTGQAQSQPITDLAPGTHQLTATYSGDANYTGSNGSSSETVTCSQTLTSGGSGPLTVTSSTCVEGGTFSGPVTVRSGGDLALIGASVNGPVTTTGAASVLFCGSSVQGPVTLTDATVAVELGGGPGSTCAQDKLNGPVTVFGGQASTSIDGTTLVGPLSVASNSGPVTLSGDSVSGPADISLDTGGVTVSNDTISGPLSVMYDTGTVVVSSNSVSGPAVVEDNSGPVAPTVSANTVGGPLECSGNTPAPGDAGAANKASGGAQGQCGTLA